MKVFRRKLWWHGSSLLAHGFGYQDYLGQPWIETILERAPERYRRRLALHLLGMSPHYFIFQGDERYAHLRSHGEVLQAEFQRLLKSREKIIEDTLSRHLRPEMVVADIGCGPGFLASWVAPRVRHVQAVDCSRGVLACARVLFPADNVTYHLTAGSDLGHLPDESLDLIYSFACFQHLPEPVLQGYLREFRRVLRPGARAMCHVVIGDPGSAPRPRSLLRRKIQLIYQPRTEEQYETYGRQAGFGEVSIVPLREVTDIEDHIRDQHLATFG